MPEYTFICKNCNSEKTEILPIGSVDMPKCCNSDMKRTFNKGFNAVIAPRNQAVKDKMKYYGIKNIVTGEGITPETDVSTPPGISLEDNS